MRRSAVLAVIPAFPKLHPRPMRTELRGFDLVRGWTISYIEHDGSVRRVRRVASVVRAKATPA
jgi:hypothetical protein